MCVDHVRGHGRRPGASLYTRKRRSLSMCADDVAGDICPALFAGFMPLLYPTPEVGPDRCCPPSHPTHLEPSLLQCERKRRKRV